MTFRVALRRWLEPYREDGPAWRAAAVAAGLCCPEWPRRYGGRGLTAAAMFVLDEELARAGLTRPDAGAGENVIGPAVLAYGSADERERILPPIARGHHRYVLAFSEASAGSDLGAVATTTDGRTVRGEKSWIDGLDTATHAAVLARAAEGPTLVLVALDAPGVTRTAFGLADGGTAHRLRLDGTPLGHVLGAPGDAARILTPTGVSLGATLADRHRRAGDCLDALVALADKSGRAGEPVAREAIGATAVAVARLRAHQRRLVADAPVGADLGVALATERVLWTALRARVAATAQTLRGASGLQADEEWSRHSLAVPVEAVAGGGAVLRDTIAAHLFDERSDGLAAWRPVAEVVR